MKYKKIAGALALFAACSSGIVHAAELSISSIKFKQDFVTISGVIEGEQNADILIYVSADTENPEKSDIVYAAQASSDEKGLFFADFEMKEEYKSADGNFFVYANSEKADAAAKKNFRFVGSETRKELIDAVNSAASAAEIKEIILKNAETCRDLGMSDKTDASEELFKNRPSTGYTDESLVEQYNTFVFIKLVNLSKGGDEIQSAINLFPEMIDKREQEAENFIADVIYNNIPYSGKAEINGQYDKAAALNVINKATRENMEQLLKDYSALLEYADNNTFKTYINSNEETRISVTKALVTAAAGTPFKSSESIITVIKNALSGQNKPGDGSSGGGSTTGGKKDSTNGNFAISTPEAGQNMEKNNTEKESIFSDVGESFWGRNAIEVLADKGILNGDGGKFRPNDKITREEFVTVAVNAFGLFNKDAECEFSDIANDAWYYRFVASAYENGIVSGKGDGTFGTGAAITREDVAVILSRLIKDDSSAEPNFSDNDKISDYAKAGVAVMQSNGIISGMEDGSFAPKNNCTRAEAATMVYLILKMQGGIV